MFLLSKRNRPADRGVEGLAYEGGEERRALSARVLLMSLNLELDQWDGSHQDLDHQGEPSFSSGYYVHHFGTEDQKRIYSLYSCSQSHQS